MAKRLRSKEAQRSRLQIRINIRILILFEQTGLDPRLADIAVRANQRLRVLQQQEAAAP